LYSTKVFQFFKNCKKSMNKFEKLTTEHLELILGGNLPLEENLGGAPTGGSPVGGVCNPAPVIPGVTGPCMHWSSDSTDGYGGITYEGVYFTGNPC
jgi:hypothetical protein